MTTAPEYPQEIDFDFFYHEFGVPEEGWWEHLTPSTNLGVQFNLGVASDVRVRVYTSTSTTGELTQVSDNTYGVGNPSFVVNMTSSLEWYVFLTIANQDDAEIAQSWTQVAYTAPADNTPLVLNPSTPNTTGTDDPIVYVSSVNGNAAPITVPNIFNFHFPVWNVVVGSNRSNTNGLAKRGQYELPNLRGRTLTVRRNEAGSSSFTISGESVEAKIIHELESDIWWYRDGVLVQRHRVNSSNDASGQTYDATFNGVGYEDLLARREVHTKPFHSYAVFPPTYSPTDVVKWLVDHAENQKGMRLGLTYSNEFVLTNSFAQLWSATQTQDTAFQVADGDGIMDTIRTACSSFQPGLEFWVDADMTIHLSLERGQNNGVILDYGGIISEFERHFDSKNYANVIRATGAGVLPSYNTSLTEDLGTPTTNTHTGVLDANINLILPPSTFSTDPKGGWQDDRSNDHIYLPSALYNFGQNEYNKSSNVEKLYSYNVTFGTGQWRGPEHVWVGDHVWFVANRGRISVREKMRVETLTISIDESGIETVTAELNISRDRDVALKAFRDAVRNIQKKKQ